MNIGMFCFWQNSVENNFSTVNRLLLVAAMRNLGWILLSFPCHHIHSDNGCQLVSNIKTHLSFAAKPFCTKNWDEFSSLQSYKFLFCHGCILKVGSNDSCHYSFDLWARNVKRACYHPNKNFLCLNQSYFINLVRT